MDEDLYVQKLAWLKRNESPEAVLFVADDAELMKIVVASGNPILASVSSFFVLTY